MTRPEMMHDLALDGDYTPSVPEEEYEELHSLISDIESWGGDLEDLADTARALAEKAEEIINWECECGR